MAESLQEPPTQKWSVNNKPNIILNVVLVQLGWFACVLGESYGYPATGPVFVLLSIFFQFRKFAGDGRIFTYFAQIALIGFISDLIIILSGSLFFGGCCTGLPFAYPYWMIALWISFSTTYFSSFEWLRQRYFLAAIIGFLGGPLAYFAGMKLNALYLGDNILYSLTIIGIIWGIAVPLMGFIHLRKFK